jgi:hypothetical protein
MPTEIMLLAKINPGSIKTTIYLNYSALHRLLFNYRTETELDHRRESHLYPLSGPQGLGQDEAPLRRVHLLLFARGCC